MKSVKKLFFAFLVLFVGIVLLGSASTTNASSAVANSTPWFISFDDGTVMNIREGETGWNDIYSNSFTVTYFDATGQTEGGYFNLWIEARTPEIFHPVAQGEYLKNGEKMSFEIGGKIQFQYDGENPDYYSTCYFMLHRSIVDTNRIRTNVVEGKYYYDRVYFDDLDNPWDVDDNLVWEVENYTTGETYEVYPYFSIDEEGDYYVTVYDTVTGESLSFDFTIDGTKPIVELIEWDWTVGTPLLGNHITSKGVKVNCSDDIELASISYRYKRFTASYAENGVVENGFTFYRKGEYTIYAEDIAGNMTIVSFIITDFDIMVDPEGVIPVGTEVTQNGGERGGTTMSVGYTRCLYLGGDAPSQSRLDYTFTSSDETIATVSAYGTVEAKAVGTVVITCVNKKNPKLVSKVILTVLP